MVNGSGSERHKYSFCHLESVGWKSMCECYRRSTADGFTTNHSDSAGQHSDLLLNVEVIVKSSLEQLEVRTLKRSWNAKRNVLGSNRCYRN